MVFPAINFIYISGFPKWRRQWGDNLGKMTKSCLKITKSVFLGQNSGGTWGDKPIFWVVRGTPQSPPLGETLYI